MKRREFIKNISSVAGATMHFRAYKEGAPHMIKSLKLVPMQSLDLDHADNIFKKWSLK